MITEGWLLTRAYPEHPEERIIPMKTLTMLSLVACLSLGSRAYAQELPLTDAQSAAAAQIVDAARASKAGAKARDASVRPGVACDEAAPVPACVPIKAWKTAYMTVRDDGGRSIDQEVEYPIFDLDGGVVKTGDNSLCWHWCQQVCDGALCHLMCWTHCAGNGGEGDPRPHQTALSIESRDISEPASTKL